MKRIYCPECGSEEFVKKGFSRNGEMRRLLCKKCGKHYSVDVKDFENYEKEKSTKKIIDDINKIANNKTSEMPDKFVKVKRTTIVYHPSGNMTSTVYHPSGNVTTTENEVSKEEPKPKDKNERVKYIYLRGPNVTTFRNLADTLGLGMELVDGRIDLYRITNPKK